ncbi:hypothetical protein ACJJTC_005727 [Scirpophaga incertulas]
MYLVTAKGGLSQTLEPSPGRETPLRARVKARVGLSVVMVQHALKCSCSAKAVRRAGAEIPLATAHARHRSRVASEKLSTSKTRKKSCTKRRGINQHAACARPRHALRNLTLHGDSRAFWDLLRFTCGSVYSTEFLNTFAPYRRSAWLAPHAVQVKVAAKIHEKAASRLIDAIIIINHYKRYAKNEPDVLIDTFFG